MSSRGIGDYTLDSPGTVCPPGGAALSRINNHEPISYDHLYYTHSSYPYYPSARFSGDACGGRAGIRCE